jgi:hypothetical protein
MMCDMPAAIYGNACRGHYEDSVTFILKVLKKTKNSQKIKPLMLLKLRDPLREHSVNGLNGNSQESSKWRKLTG